MLLTFKGFPDGWKSDDAAYVDGYGSVEKGETREFPDDLSAFLLATHVFAEENAVSSESASE